MQVELIALNFIVLFGGSYGISTLLLKRSEKKIMSRRSRRGIAASVQRW